MTANSTADVLLIAAAVVWILVRQVRLAPVKPRLLVLAPLLLAYFGVRDEEFFTPARQSERLAAARWATGSPPRTPASH